MLWRSLGNTDTPHDLRAAARLRAIRTVTLNGALAETIRALAASGVEPILLKGQVFAQWLYDDPTERLSNDIDLLIAPDQFGAARRSLAELGFELWQQPAHARERPDHHEIWVRNNSMWACVELHHKLFLMTADRSLIWRRLIEDATRLDVAGVQVYAPNETACAMIAALHVAQHGLGWSRPKADLERAVARVDLEVWRAAAALADELGAGPAFVVGLRQIPRGRNVVGRLGLSAAGASRSVRLRAGTAPGAAMAIEWFVEQLLTTTGVRARMRFLARLAVPAPSWMLEGYPFARRGPGWLVTAYLVRPFRIAKMLPAGLWTWVTAALGRGTRGECGH
jgi:hypothetical protein